MESKAQKKKMENDNDLEDHDLEEDRIIEYTENIDSDENDNTSIIMNGNVTVNIFPSKDERKGSEIRKKIFGNYIPRPYFVARMRELKKMRENFAKDRYWIISGTGGIGKTTFACHYAEIHEKEYSWIFILDASRLDSLRRSFQMIWSEIFAGVESPNLSEYQFNFILHDVISFLKKNNDWLLIFDGVEDEDEVAAQLKRRSQYYPDNPRGHVLITTRLPVSYFEYHKADVQLEQFTDEEAKEFFKKMKSFKQHSGDIDLLLEHLKFRSPLMLDQVAGYIVQKSRTIQEYIKEMVQGEKVPVIDPQNGKDPVTKTFEKNFRAVESVDKETMEILTFVKFCHPKDIPIYLFEKENEDGLRVKDRLTVAKNYSLINFEQGQHSFRIHKEVQEALLQRGSREENRDHLLCFAKKLLDRIKSPTTSLIRARQLLPHIESCIRHMSSSPLCKEFGFFELYGFMVEIDVIVWDFDKFFRDVEKSEENEELKNYLLPKVKMTQGYISLLKSNFEEAGMHFSEGLILLETDENFKDHEYIKLIQLHARYLVEMCEMKKADRVLSKVEMFYMNADKKDGYYYNHFLFTKGRFHRNKGLCLLLNDSLQKRKLAIEEMEKSVECFSKLKKGSKTTGIPFDQLCNHGLLCNIYEVEMEFRLGDLRGHTSEADFQRFIEELVCLVNKLADVIGKKHLHYAVGLSKLAWLMLKCNRDPKDVLVKIDQAIGIAQEVFKDNPRHFRLALMKNIKGRALMKLGRYKEALDLLQEVLPVIEDTQNHYTVFRTKQHIREAKENIKLVRVRPTTQDCRGQLQRPWRWQGYLHDPSIILRSLLETICHGLILMQYY